VASDGPFAASSFESRCGFPICSAKFGASLRSACLIVGPQPRAEPRRKQCRHSVTDRTDNQSEGADAAQYGEVIAMMHTYRCYLLNGHRHIAAVEVIECRDDGIAKRRAEKILAAQPAFSGVEVWEWDRRVHVRLSSDAVELH